MPRSYGILKSGCFPLSSLWSQVSCSAALTSLYHMYRSDLYHCKTLLFNIHDVFTARDAHCIVYFSRKCTMLHSAGRFLCRRKAVKILKSASLATCVPLAAFSIWSRNENKKELLTENGLRRFWNRLFSTSDWSITKADDLADYINDGKIKKVVVMVGAGISTPSGIPDFRSPGTGLYDNLQKYNLPYPEAVFDIDYFSFEPKPFFSLAKELYPSGQYKPNVVHHFIQLLNNKGLLHRLYTQNIDGLERLAGVPAEKMVEAHGTFHTATCRVCYKSYEGKEIQEDIFNGQVPRCRRKLCNGIIKPDIVFFGEQLPSRFYLFMADMPQADLLLVMGTSLEVQPFAGISEATLPGVPRLLINREIAGPFQYSPRKNDVVLEGDLVEKVWEFADTLGWKSELKDLINNYENR